MKMFRKPKPASGGDVVLESTTATTADVISPKTFYTGDGVKRTGVLPSFPEQWYQPIKVIESSNIDITFNRGAYTHNNPGICIRKKNMADIIGLTADIILEGNTILDIAGTAKKVVADTNTLADWVANKATLSEVDGGIKILCNTQGTYSGACTAAGIDVTDLKSVIVEITDVNTGALTASGNHTIVKMSDTLINSGNHFTYDTNAQTIEKVGTYSFDVTELTGKKYFYVQAGYTANGFVTVGKILTI